MRQSSVTKMLGSTNERNPENCPQLGPVNLPEQWHPDVKNYEVDNGYTCVTYIRVTFDSPSTLARQLKPRIGTVVTNGQEFTVKVGPDYEAYVKNHYQVKATYSIRVPQLQRFKPLFNNVQSGSTVTWTFNGTNSTLIEITGKLAYKNGDEEATQNKRSSLEEIKKKASEKIPKEWGEGAPSNEDKGEGWKWTNPKNKGDEVRVMRGDPNDPFPRRREDYVQVRRNGQVVGEDGQSIIGGKNVPTGASPEAHIPLTTWLQWSTPLKP